MEAEPMKQEATAVVQMREDGDLDAGLLCVICSLCIAPAQVMTFSKISK